MLRRAESVRHTALDIWRAFAHHPACSRCPARLILFLCVGQRRLIEKWPCIHDVLVQQCGSARDHAVLLCSLLLGFYLDAFVCVGTVVASTVGDDDAKVN